MRVRPVVATLLLLFGLLTLLDRFAPLEVLLARTASPLPLALVEALAMVGFGALLRRAKRLDLPLDFLLGYPAFGAALFLVSLLRLSAGTLLPLLILGCIAGVVYLLKWYSDEESPVRDPVPLHWTALFVALVLGYALVSGERPQSAIPHTWLLEGRAVDLPLLAEAKTPLGIQSAELLPLVLLGPARGGTAAHILYWLSALATTTLILRRTRSWLATAAIVTTPAALAVWPLTGIFVALYSALEDDDRKTASAATAAGLLTSFFFIPFAVAAWALKRRLPDWSVLLGLVFFFRGELPAIPGERAVALSDYVFEKAFALEALGASIFALPVFATGGVAIAAAVLALVLFVLAAPARMLVPYLAVASVSGAPNLRLRLLAALVAFAVALQTFMVLKSVPPKPAPPASVAWLNATLPRDSRTLLIGESDARPFARRVRAGEIERVSEYLELQNADAVRERLRADGITHVAVIEKEGVALTPGAQRMLAQTLDRYAATVTSQGDATVFTLR
ncbi:MAG TPA: hypothetical protein VGF28_09050 [Thermoanaerobaculia bacterium]